MLTAITGSEYRKLTVPSSGSTTHCSGARGADMPLSSPRNPAAGVAPARSSRISASASTSVCVTTSVGEDFAPIRMAPPIRARISSAAASATDTAVASSDPGS